MNGNKGIVNILNANKISIGTGFFVSSNGYILTCYHVLKDHFEINEKIAFTCIVSKEIHFAKFIDKNEEKDIALLQSDLSSIAFYTVKEYGKKGDRLTVWGFPNNSRIAILAEPIIQDYIESDKYIQLKDADTITYGFSGAPLIAEDGAVVGMVAYIPIDNSNRMGNIAFAIPSKLIIDTYAIYIDIAKKVEMGEAAHPTRVSEDSQLPHVLTKSVVAFADEQNIIHRESELKELEILLSTEKKALFLSGFGGIGKTSLARVLFSKLYKNYDSIGWIEYRGDLKTSILATMELYEDIENQEKRWEVLSRRLKNDCSRKLLFVDNVDRDTELNQDPLTDKILADISGFPNMSVVLTSRLDEIQGYIRYKVNYLGDKEQRKMWCSDLFYFFYNKEEYYKTHKDRVNREVVYDLVELAGYHTYAVELLAKSAKYETSLENFLDEIKISGFQFPSLNIYTNHRHAYANAAGQLRKLFDMRTCTKQEKHVLWDFSILPNISLTAEEINKWFGYVVNELSRLVDEGWLLFRGGFYMHPLIKETILLDMQNGKAPVGTASKLVQCLNNGDFITREEPYTIVIRKLDIAANILKFVPIQEETVAAKIYFTVGYYFFVRARRRLTAISHFIEALNIYRELESAFPNLYTENIAEVSYQLGYVESATNGYREKSEEHLKEALNIRRRQEADNPGKYVAEIAKVCDHLGYVLSDMDEHREEAKALLLEALCIRRKLEAETPLMYEADVATTCDNLGRLLFLCNDRKEAENYLKEALNIRQKLALENPEMHLAEVAWTCHNLGDVLSSDANCICEAEKFYREALRIRRQLEYENPGMYVGNIAWTCASLAKLLFSDMKRVPEVKELCNEVIDIRQNLDSDHLGFFIDEVASECQKLLDGISDINIV